MQARRLIKRRREAVVALTANGWPSAAKRSHSEHNEYARRTLLAYMPCPELRGIDYIEQAAVRHYDGRWDVFLKDFVADLSNCWCPSWIRRNYEILNADVNEVKSHEPASTTSDKTSAQPNTSAPVQPAQYPHQSAKTTFIFEEPAEPPSPHDDEDPAAPTSTAAPLPYDPWEDDQRPTWQLHSELGPNVDAEACTRPEIVLPPVVNPTDFDWGQHGASFDSANIHDMWAQISD